MEDARRDGGGSGIAKVALASEGDVAEQEQAVSVGAQISDSPVFCLKANV